MSDSRLASIKDENGAFRLLGALPRVMSRCGDGLIAELDDVYLVAESAWPKLSKVAGKIVFTLAQESPSIDQGPQGSCTYSALLHNVMERREESGYSPILLAQCTGYAWDGIDGRGNLIPRSRDNGMALDVAILLARMVGGLPANLVDPLDWQRRSWVDNWRSIAYRNSVDKWRDCSGSMRMIVSSLCQGVPLLHGYAQHARMLVAFDSDNNRFRYKNTYGMDWNEDGFGWLSWAQVDSGRKQYGAFAALTVRDPEGDGDAPTS